MVGVGFYELLLHQAVGVANDQRALRNRISQNGL